MTNSNMCSWFSHRYGCRLVLNLNGILHRSTLQLVIFLSIRKGKTRMQKKEGKKTHTTTTEIHLNKSDSRGPMSFRWKTKRSLNEQ